MLTEQQIPSKKTSWLILGAFFAAIGASVCCVVPLLLLSLGIGGAWMSTLTSLQAVRPFFIILTLILMGLGYRKLYLVAENCNQGATCASPEVKHKQRMIFCISSGLILLLLTFPWYAPFFMT